MSFLKEDEITIFAKTNFRGEERSFGIKTDDRRRHMYIIGKTGMGKSVTITNLVIQDIEKGRGVAFIDPHGDSAEEVLRFIPKNRINDVVYFNPSDLEFPVAFNILEAVDEDHKHLIASGMMGVFKKIWPDVWSARMEYILSNTILALLDYPGSTMLGINRMMSDKDFRDKVIEKVRDPIVRSFWIEEFGKWDKRFASEATAAIQNKVGQFVSTPIVRHIVGQPVSTINMREIMDQGKILIVNLAKGRIGEDAMALLGGMIVTRLYLAAMERVDISEKERKDFYLYVDEFQNFATESFASILSEARKYRLNLIVAHQYVSQLSEQVRDAVFGNVGTLVSFRVGAVDAEFLEKEFEPAVYMNDIINLPKYQIYLKLMIDGVSGNAFSAKTLPPFPEPQNSYAELAIKSSREKYGNPREEVEEKISKWMKNTFRDEKAEQNKENFDRKNNFVPAEEEKKDNPQKFMFPSQIIGFSDGQNEKVEEGFKKEFAKSVPKEALEVASSSQETINSEEKNPNEEIIPPKVVLEEQQIPVSEGEKEESKVVPQEELVVKEQTTEEAPSEKQNTWNDAFCDRCGKETKVPFVPEPGRGVFCKDCLREVRRQKALLRDETQQKTQNSIPTRPNSFIKANVVTDEEKSKLKEDLREIIQKIKTE